MTVEQTKIFGTDYGILYGLKNRVNGKKVIGSKIAGEPLTYVTSLGHDNEFWDDYRAGHIDRFILARPSVSMTTSSEWMALDYGLSECPDNFYNVVNSAHKGDGRVDPDIMKNVINFIAEDDFEDFTPTISETSARTQNVIKCIEEGFYPVVMTPIDTVLSYSRKQVRVVLTNIATATKIRDYMNENPEGAREKFSPIVVVVMPDGSHCVNDGNTRLTAADWARWNEVSTIFVPWTDLTDNPSELPVVQELLGSGLNRENDTFRGKNSQNDLKMQFDRIVSEKLPNFDPTNESAKEYVKVLLTDYFLTSGIIPTKVAFNGTFKSFITMKTREANERLIKGNLITYTDGELTKKKYLDYEQHGIACVTATADKLSYGHACAYIMRHMKQTGWNKGAIIIHYTSKSQIVKVREDDLIRENEEFLKYWGLDVTIEVLPFSSES